MILGDISGGQVFDVIDEWLCLDRLYGCRQECVGRVEWFISLYCRLATDLLDWSSFVVLLHLIAGPVCLLLPFGYVDCCFTDRIFLNLVTVFGLDGMLGTLLSGFGSPK